MPVYVMKIAVYTSVRIYVVVPVYKLQIFWSCGFLKHKGFYGAQYKIKGGNLAQNFPELEEQKV